MSSVSVGGQGLQISSARQQAETVRGVTKRMSEKIFNKWNILARSAKVTSSPFIELLFSHKFVERESRESENEGK